MGLITYSGIATKIRAMESRLFTPQQFREMAVLEDVRSAADYLKQQPAYADIFTRLNDNQLHRGNIEFLLTRSEYQDFARLYRFSGLSQRRFLDLYFMHYEINIIRRVLHNVMSGKPEAIDLSDFQQFFDRHSSIDLVKLAQAENLGEFAAELKGSSYDMLFSQSDPERPLSLTEYEIRLDLLYFNTMWKVKDKILTGQERKIIRHCFGSRLDLLNIQWIYRSKKYYRLPASDIYALLIPVKYKLRTEQIRRMAEAPSLEEFFSLLSATHYGKLPEAQWSGQPDVEGMYQQILNRIYNSTGRRYPYTIAVIDSYLYAKEREIRRIIATIEGIRYGLDPDAIIDMASKQ
jgi:V/A-type H+-transporting ATPase subunit C